MASEIAAAGVRRAARELHGIVVSAGLMDKTVKVRLGGQRWEQRVHKWFKEPRHKLVHDPANSLRQGDVVAITSSIRFSQHVRHVVKHIIAPYGEAIDARPPIPTLAELVAARAARLESKQLRKALDRRVGDAARATEKILSDARRTLARAELPPKSAAT
ncbi:hypothetical protein F5Y14DRAFT_324013 [Nemania sp. NC0429]|nr:hypothetical protein F5Y14DRAFT_324013 [Nemania sp. NC0429]